MDYSIECLEHFNAPQNVGLINNLNGIKEIWMMLGENVKIRLQVKLNNNIIKDIKFKAYGNPALIASISLLSTLVKNKTIEDALTIKSDYIASLLKLSPSQIIYAIFVLDTLYKLLCE